jgi:hypothetical protein
MNNYDISYTINSLFNCDHNVIDTVTIQLGDINIVGDIRTYRLQWIVHLHRMDNTRLPMAANYCDVAAESRNSGVGEDGNCWVTVG